MATEWYIAHCSLPTPVTYSPHHLLSLSLFLILSSLLSDFYLPFYDLVLSMFYLCVFTCAFTPLCPRFDLDFQIGVPSV